ncbi:MAG: PilZ domain-containing protein [Deltaproteobacteria bacterium]|jgi:Tfp pilus assembly protein PilZ|nr:PilZ domain-containing protein [Deltaproteobacteria bacterium]
MSRYSERRAGARIEFKSLLKIKNLKNGTFSNARMVNYCDNGLYFESNSTLAEGAEIILGIENSPYSNGSNVMDVYRAKVLWRTPVQSTFYTYGYGAQLLTQSNGKMADTAKGDMRKYPRWNCSQSICFFSRNRKYKGILKNVCPNGLFIETPATLPVGQTIELKVRDNKTNKVRMLSGEIVRSRPGGVGIRVKKICDANAEKRF